MQRTAISAIDPGQINQTRCREIRCEGHIVEAHLPVICHNWRACNRLNRARGGNMGQAPGLLGHKKPTLRQGRHGPGSIKGRYRFKPERGFGAGNGAG